MIHEVSIILTSKVCGRVDIVAHVTWFARFSEELTCDVIISIVTHDIDCMTTNRVDTGHDAIQASFGRTDGKCPHHFLSFHNFKRLFQNFHCEEAKKASFYFNKAQFQYPYIHDFTKEKICKLTTFCMPFGRRKNQKYFQN